MFIDNSYTPEEMVDTFFAASDVIPSNVVFTGSNAGYAFFDAGDTDLGINAGILLSTGETWLTAGPAEFHASTSLNVPGDIDLEAQVADGLPSFDASVLEMDITPFTDTICFFYVFGSEEYPEWTFTQFNDVFAFLISGGPEYPEPTNIAMIPETDPPVAVSINTINQFLFPDFYVPQYVPTPDGQNIASYFGEDVVYDGHTVLLPAKAYVTPGETYHIKIGVTDVSDAAFDSGVFIGIQSLGGDSLLVPTANAELTVVGDSLVVENESMFAKDFDWDFGDGTTSTERHPEAHTYETPGEYIVTLTVSSWCCSDTYTEAVSVGVMPIAADFSASTSEACVTEEISFTDLSSGNIVQRTWNFPGGSPNYSTEPNPVVSYSESGNYTVSLTVSDETGQTIVEERQDYIQVTPLPVAGFEFSSSDLTVAFLDQSTDASLYLWDFGDGNQSSEPNPVHGYAESGAYPVTLTVTNECGTNTWSSSVELMPSSVTTNTTLPFRLYPNPALDQVQIQPDFSGSYQIEVYTLTGKTLHSYRNLQGTEQLSLTNLPTGSYLLQIQSGDKVATQLLHKK